MGAVSVIGLTVARQDTDRQAVGIDKLLASNMAWTLFVKLLREPPMQRDRPFSMRRLLPLGERTPTSYRPSGHIQYKQLKIRPISSCLDQPCAND